MRITVTAQLIAKGIIRRTRRYIKPVRTGLIATFCTLYLMTLGVGVFAHTFGFGHGSHPMMYFIVWDMFCGWSAHDTRYHVVAEGVSGAFYDVLPGPWTDVHPHGQISRHHYDPNATFCGRIALNVLRHTKHENITRLFVVEEAWPKKFNMPEDQWAARFDEPKDPKNYFRVRNVIAGDGTLLQLNDDWQSYQANLGILSNPRITAEYYRSRPFLAIDTPIPTSTFGPGTGVFGGPLSR